MAARSRPQEDLSTPGQGQGEGPDDSKSERSEDDALDSSTAAAGPSTPLRDRINSAQGPGMALRLRKRPFDSAQGPGMVLRMTSN